MALPGITFGEIVPNLRVKYVRLGDGQSANTDIFRMKAYYRRERGGESRTAIYRRKIARLLAYQLMSGSNDAAKRLGQRGRALKGIQMHGWERRLTLASAAWRRICDERKRIEQQQEQQARTLENERKLLQSTREL